MLLLSSLGAKTEIILNDYLMTNDYNAEMLNYIKSQVSDINIPPEKLNALLFINGGVSEGYLLHALATLKKHYGNPEGYLREALGIGHTEIQLLRDKFLCQDAIR